MRALLAAFALVAFATFAHAEDRPSAPLHPFWTGPVYGVFNTGAGPDSIEGAKAKIHVPIGVALTKPFSVKGYQITPEAQFEWTTKAYLGEDSDPLRDAQYNWFPHLRIVPEHPSLLQWVKLGPDHNSNGADGLESRSVDVFSTEASFAWMWAGIQFDLYAKGWVAYAYGENTAGISDAINLVDDFGGKVILRGSVDMLELATELGPEWQKVMAYVPLQDFYNFGLYGEYHHGKAEGMLDYASDVTTFGGGFAFKP